MKTLFNVCWVIFVGLSSAITSAVIGISMCFTIVGIPFGLQHLKFIKLIFAPAGKAVATRFGKHPVMNSLWLIFGGLPSFIFYYALAMALVVTIIGIPIANQLVKLASFCLAPFGAEVVEDGCYTAAGDTGYDFGLFFPRMAADLDKVVGENPDGSGKTMRQVLTELRPKAKQFDFFVNRIFHSVMPVAAFAVAVIYIVKGPNPGIALELLIVLSLMSAIVGPGLAVSVGVTNAFYRKHFREYLQYYPKGSQVLKWSTLWRVYKWIDEDARKSLYRK